MAFALPTTVSTVPEEVIKYSSGYTESEEIEIKSRKKEIESRNLVSHPVTIEEFRNTIAPWFRINRTEEFILHPTKVKVVRVPKEKVVKEKVIKEKKLTKAQTSAKMQDVIVKTMSGIELTEEEKEFYKIQIGE